MKPLFFIIAIMMTFTVFAQSTSEKTEFKVYGVCGMCEARIEKAAMSAEGVISADWSQETQILALVYDPVTADLDDIHQLIADAGHDTEKVRAKDETYNSLPACCHYERREKDKSGQDQTGGRSCCSRQ